MNFTAREARRPASGSSPLLRQVREDRTPAVIAELRKLLPTLTEVQAKKVRTTVEYQTNNLHCMKYAEGERRHEPVDPARSGRRAGSSRAG